MRILQNRFPKNPKRRMLIYAALAIFVVVLGPYVISRVMSPWRALSVGTIDVSQESKAELDYQDRDLRVVCYNIAHGRGLAGSNWEGGTNEVRAQRLDAIADLLVELDADVVVLNEIDFDASWSDSVDQADYLAKRAGYPHVAKLRNLDFVVGIWRWRFGNAVLSRTPFTEAKEIEVPGYKRWETALAGKKRALFCEVQVGGQAVGLIAAHLSHRSESLRVRSAERLLGFASTYDRPLIIAGDLNSAPTGFPGTRLTPSGQNAMDVFDQSGRFRRTPEADAAEPSAYTFRTDTPTRTIDWILVDKACTVQDYFAVDSMLSDHRPVVADIDLGDGVDEER